MIKLPTDSVKGLLQKLSRFRMNKYWALGLVCALLLGSVLLSGGLRAQPEPLPTGAEPVSEATTAATEPAAPEPPPELRMLEGLELLPEESVFGLCRDGELAAALLQRWDPEARVWQSRLLRLDPETASVLDQVRLEPLGESAEFSALELTDTEIRFVDPEHERCAAFDRTGRFLGVKDHPLMEKEHLGWRNRLLGDDCFYKEQGWAGFDRSDSGRLNRVLGFYDEADKLYVLKEPFDQLCGVSGHRLLGLDFREEELELSLLDLDSDLCLDRLTLRPEDQPGGQWVNLSDALQGPDWVLLSLTWDGLGEEGRRLCFWYPESGGETPLETELLTEQSLSDEIGVLCDKLGRMGMELHLDEAPPTEQTPTTGLSSFENTCETGASLFGQYWILSQLTEFAEKLPAGMIREMSGSLPGSEGEEQPLQVWIVREIPGDAAAFANAWSVPPMVCFATREYGPTHLAHEFMHVMDLRLSLWLESQRRELEEEWAGLSPDWAYEEELSQERSDELEAYFVSWYARTNSNEDRAETFQAMFDSQEPAAEQWWYQDKPGVQAKARWLCQAIRGAFPSVQAVERAWWEKLPPEPTEEN